LKSIYSPALIWSIILCSNVGRPGNTNTCLLLAGGPLPYWASAAVRLAKLDCTSVGCAIGADTDMVLALLVACWSTVDPEFFMAGVLVVLDMGSP